MNRNNFTQGQFNTGVTAAGIGMPGSLMNFGTENRGGGVFDGESNFGVGNQKRGFAMNPASQNMVGYAIGQQWMPMNPIRGENGGYNNFGSGFIGESGYLSEEDKRWADMFYNSVAEFETAENSEESGLTFGEKLKNVFSRVSPPGIILRAAWSNKYCKSLGYMRSADKNAFKKCVAATKINYVLAQKGKWTYPAAPEGIEEKISPEELAAASVKEVASMPPDQKEQVYINEAGEAGVSVDTPKKSNTMMYVIIGAVALIIIVALIMFMRKKAATA